MKNRILENEIKEEEKSRKLMLDLHAQVETATKRRSEKMFELKQWVNNQLAEEQEKFKLWETKQEEKEREMERKLEMKIWTRNMTIEKAKSERDLMDMEWKAKN